MPRCPAHCPPSDSGPLLPAALIAGVFAVAATWTVIVHILTILLITIGIIAGLGAAGLTVVTVIRLRDIAHGPRAPASNLPAPAAAPRTNRAAAADQRQITSGRVPAADSPQSRESGHRPTPAIEQHWHLHVHGTSEQQPARVPGQTPGRMPGAAKQAQLPRDGGHHDA